MRNIASTRAHSHFMLLKEHSPGWCIVAEPMGVGLRNTTAQAMVAEEGAQSGGCHGPSPPTAFQGDEQGRGVGERPFQPQIFFKDLDHFRRQRQNAFLVPFAEDSHVCFGELQILDLKSQHLARAQTVQQHQAHQGEIAKGAKAAPELGDFLSREWHNDALGLP